MSGAHGNIATGVILSQTTTVQGTYLSSPAVFSASNAAISSARLLATAASTSPSGSLHKDGQQMHICIYDYDQVR
jgi:hypothetical protein